MRQLTDKIILSVLLIGLSFQVATQVADTLGQAPSPRQEGQKVLPQIQMQEYTIVGLSKITLPRKVRTQIFKNIEINWVDNKQISQKKLPEIAFRFARIKPSLFRLYEFPWLDSRIYYGSYNLAGVDVKSQFKTNRTLPYFSANFGRSDGHLENARWTEAGMRAGIHHQFKEGHLFHAGTDYQFNTRGIWADWEKYRQKWNAETVLWSFFTALDQQWSKIFSTSLGGTFYLDDHENGFKYSDRGFDLFAGFGAQIQDLRLEGRVKYQQTDLAIEDGNLAQLPPDTISLNDYKASLLNSALFVKQKYYFITAEMGVIFQQTKEELTKDVQEKKDDNFLYPHFSVSFKLGDRGNVYLSYLPAAELYRFRNSIRQLPFSDLSQLRVIDYHTRFEAGLNVNYPKRFEFNVTGSSAKADKFPGVIAPADSLNAVFSQGGYPGWIYGVLDKATLQEIRTKLRWELFSHLSVLGLFVYRKSEIREFNQYPTDVKGNEIPYFPDIEASGDLSWNFYKQHKIVLSIKYTGKRFDDITNEYQLDSYFLLNSRLYLQISRNFGFYLAGKNLLDTNYDLWRGFSAPGITGFLGIKIRM